LLISSLAQHLRISSEQSQQMVAQFVGNLQSDLARNQRCELKGIGIFRYNAEHKLEFEYVEAEDNYLSHSFGLPELVARPVVPAEPTVLRTVRRQTEEVKQVKKKGGFVALSKKYATAAGTLVLGGITVAFVYFVSLQPEYTIGSLNPASLFQNQAEPVAEETVAYSEPKVTEIPAQTLEELPLTPEAISVEAIESDFADNTVSEAEGTQEPLANEIPVGAPAKPVNTPAVAKNGRENPAKTAEPIIKNRSSETVKTVAIAAEKAEPKAAAKAEQKALAKAETKPEKKTVAKAAEKEVVKKEVALASAGRTIKAETGRYFIISGGYSSLANAERSQKDLAAKGANPEIILPAKGSKIHRVSIAEFETLELAAAKLPELRKQYGNALWILNY
jgi:hypothetical protein